MKRFRSALLLALCFGTLAYAEDVDVPLTPMQAIERAAAVAPGGVRGVFEMEVRATGKSRLGPTYLNSEADFRDPRCLTIVVPRALLTTLTGKFGAAPATWFKDKRIRVEGIARRERIDFTAHGRPTGKYYYQTHVQLESADDIAVIDAASNTH